MSHHRGEEASRMNVLKVSDRTRRWGDLAEAVARYLPSNYQVVEDMWSEDGSTVLVVGEDHLGWTAEDYVIPRLASGLYTATRIVTDWAVEREKQAEQERQWSALVADAAKASDTIGDDELEEHAENPPGYRYGWMDKPKDMIGLD